MKHRRVGRVYSTSDGKQLIHLFTLSNVLLNQNEKKKEQKSRKNFNTLFTAKFANDVINETRGTEPLSYTPKDLMRDTENEFRITKKRRKQNVRYNTSHNITL